MNRRDFIGLLGLAGGASALASCEFDRRTEKIIPYLVPPDDGTIPGVSHYVNTTSMVTGEGNGVAAKVINYRVGKLEGIADHPVNQGALSALDQASLATLYHPNRIAEPLERTADGEYRPITWDVALERVVAALRDGRAGQSGRRNVWLSGRTTGSLSALIDTFADETGVERLPEFELHSYAAIRDANRIVFGQAAVPEYKIEKSDFLLTIGADILETFASPVAHGFKFGAAKRSGHFSWYHAEPHRSLTGVNAEHRYAIAPGSEAYLLAFLLRKIAEANVGGERHIANVVAALPNRPDPFFAEKTGLTVDQLNDILSHLKKAHHPLVIAGGVSTRQASGRLVAIMAALLQWGTGQVNDTVDFTYAQNHASVGSAKDLQALARRLSRDEVGVIFMHDVDPVGTPMGSALVENLQRAGMRVGMGQFLTPTMETCDLVLPLSDQLESWGDVQARRGIIGVVQPATEPVLNSKTAGDMLLAMIQAWNGDAVGRTYQDYLFARWKSRMSNAQIDRLLQSGYVDERPSRVSAILDGDAASVYLRSARLPEDGVKPALYVAPSLRFGDGAQRHLPLLHEVPDPLSTVSWGAYVAVSKETAMEMDINDKDEVAVSTGNWSTEVHAVVVPGTPRGVMVMHYNGEHATPFEIVEDSGEINALFSGVKIHKTGKVIALPILAGSKSQEGRGVIPSGDHGGGHGDSQSAGDHGNGHNGNGGDKAHSHHHHDPNATLYPENEYKDYRWGMVIDLDLCTGCSACSVACYVENNLPVVGAEMHLQGREMSWIRLEPFYDERSEEPEIQPMLCQHCSNAPCETVCPVFATYHSEEGINAQIYNRCVGTRYCANNCPYKVRRFNWFDQVRPSDMNSTRNPEVSVRGRGVMEKCTFCVQRVRKARDHAKDEERKVQDGEVTPACAQTCPSSAITFGNMLDERSEVAKLSKSERAYRVFEMLGTQPAVRYLSSNWKKDHA